MTLSHLQRSFTYSKPFHMWFSFSCAAVDKISTAAQCVASRGLSAVAELPGIKCCLIFKRQKLGEAVEIRQTIKAMSRDRCQLSWVPASRSLRRRSLRRWRLVFDILRQLSASAEETFERTRSPGDCAECRQCLRESCLAGLSREPRKPSPSYTSTHHHCRQRHTRGHSSEYTPQTNCQVR